MFGFKKIVTAAVAVAALAIPSLALADNDDGRRDRDVGRDNYVVEQLRAEIQRDRLELNRDLREHRWVAARREQNEIRAKQYRLNELLRARGERGEHGRYDRR